MTVEQIQKANRIMYKLQGIEMEYEHFKSNTNSIVINPEHPEYEMFRQKADEGYKQQIESLTKDLEAL